MHGFDLMPAEHYECGISIKNQNKGLGAFHCKGIINTEND
jgi:hypothetical protein